MIGFTGPVLFGGEGRGTPAHSASSTPSGETRHCPFTRQVTLHFGKRRVLVQLGDELDELTHSAPEAIELPHDQRIARPQMKKGGGETRPIKAAVDSLTHTPSRIPTERKRPPNAGRRSGQQDRRDMVDDALEISEQIDLQSGLGHSAGGGLSQCLGGVEAVIGYRAASRCLPERHSAKRHRQFA